MLEDIFEFKILNSNKPVEVIGLNKKVQAFYVWNLFRASNKNILLIANTLYDAHLIYKSFNRLITISLYFNL